MRQPIRGAILGLLALLLLAGCPDEEDEGDAGADTGADASPMDVADTAGDGEDGGGDTGGPDTSDDGGDATDSSTPGDTAPDAMDTGSDTRETPVDGGDTSEGDVVVVQPDGEDGEADAEPQCMMDAECPGRAVCDKGQCRYYRVVQIKDVTRDNSPSAGAACSEQASGADLFQLELRGPFGTVLGYGEAVTSKLTASVNTKAGQVFDGASNSLMATPQGDLCPSGGFNDDSVVSMGCDGTMALQFTDGAGMPVNLAAGQELIVHEYDQQCCQSGCSEDYWEVRVCTAQVARQVAPTMPDKMGNYPTCDTTVLKVDRGRGSVRIALPRP